MIYESTILHAKAVNEEKELDAFFEQVEDRFEHESIAEACTTIIAEQEINWNRLMTAIGMDELSSVMEGTEIIYEGGRLESLKATLEKWFNSAKEKLAELTKAFMNQVDKFMNKIDKATIKKFKDVKVPSDFTYSGYEFRNLEKTPEYKYTTILMNNPTQIVNDREKYNKNVVTKELLGVETSDIGVTLKARYYGSKEKVQLKNINIEEQLKYITNGGKLKSEAKQSYKAAARQLDKIIKDLKSFGKSADEGTDLARAINIAASYYKTFSNLATQVHRAYMQAIGARSRQALDICVKAYVANKRAENRTKKAVKDAKKNPGNVKQLTTSNEGYVDTSAFLGAVEFI